MRAGQTAGFYVKLIGLAGDLSSFKLYFTSVTRAIATCACDINFESTLVDQFPTSTAADFAPLEAGIVDEETYIEQGLKWADFHWAALEYILTEVQPDTDLLMLGNPVTDEFSHQFLGLTSPSTSTATRTRTTTTSRTTTSPTAASRSARATSAMPITRPTRRWTAPST